ncbi:MAG: heavy metal response regulator transcription factor [Pseudomonadaceae bacterium]|nr:heavy metal response regulator transcription factor [Pseudomonadaceae bacterium]
MKVLVIEDEQKTGDYLQTGLSEAGFVVDLSRNGLDGLYQAINEPYDLLIVDIMLPDLDGWRIVETLRSKDEQIPILFLTAKDSVEDRVKGLELGADDYLVKPFAFSELLARVRSLLRRGTPQVENNQLAVADLKLDLPRRQVTRAGGLIHLTNKEFTLLELLVRRQDEVLPRSLIASLVWDMNFDSDTNVIDVAIRRLRAKIDEPYELKLIKTIRGMGYTLNQAN